MNLLPEIAHATSPPPRPITTLTQSTQLSTVDATTQSTTNQSSTTGTKPTGTLRVTVHTSSKYFNLAKEIELINSNICFS